MNASLGVMLQMLYYNIFRNRDRVPDAAVEVHTGMKWFRSNVRLGSRLALFALAIQFLLSFGHSHGSAAQAAPTLPGTKQPALHERVGSAATGLGALVGVSREDTSRAIRHETSSRHEPSGQPTDDCAICAVIALANALVVGTPPDLPGLNAAAFPHLIADAGVVDPDSPHVAFQPRAPPLS
jgi:hypothetical protein